MISYQTIFSYPASLLSLSLTLSLFSSHSLIYLQRSPSLHFLSFLFSALNKLPRPRNTRKSKTKRMMLLPDKSARTRDEEENELSCAVFPGSSRVRRFCQPLLKVLTLLLLLGFSSSSCLCLPPPPPSSPPFLPYFAREICQKAPSNAEDAVVPFPS